MKVDWVLNYLKGRERVVFVGFFEKMKLKKEIKELINSRTIEEDLLKKLAKDVNKKKLENIKSDLRKITLKLSSHVKVLKDFHLRLFHLRDRYFKNSLRESESIEKLKSLGLNTSWFEKQQEKFKKEVREYKEFSHEDTISSQHIKRRDGSATFLDYLRGRKKVVFIPFEEKWSAKKHIKRLISQESQEEQYIDNLIKAIDKKDLNLIKSSLDSIVDIRPQELEHISDLENLLDNLIMDLSKDLTKILDVIKELKDSGLNEDWLNRANMVANGRNDDLLALLKKKTQDSKHLEKVAIV